MLVAAKAGPTVDPKDDETVGEMVVMSVDAMVVRWGVTEAGVTDASLEKSSAGEMA